MSGRWEHRVYEEIAPYVKLKTILIERSVSFLVLTDTGGLERKFTDEVQEQLDKLDFLIAETIHSFKPKIFPIIATV